MTLHGATLGSEKFQVNDCTHCCSPYCSETPLTFKSRNAAQQLERSARIRLERVVEASHLLLHGFF